MYNNSSNLFNDYYYQDWSSNNTDYYKPQQLNIGIIDVKEMKRKLKGKWTLELEKELEILFGINEKQKNEEFIKENEFKL